MINILKDSTHSPRKRSQICGMQKRNTCIKRALASNLEVLARSSKISRRGLPESHHLSRNWLGSTQGGYLVPEKDSRIRRAFKLLMVGPDGAGKTSVLFALKARQGLQEVCGACR
jgi:hypothetical protein